MVKTVGFELSSQSMKVVVLDSDEGLIYKETINYDDRFKNSYDIKKGLLNLSTGEKHAPPGMLVEAIDACFKQMKADGIDLSDVAGFKIDSMQHCSVYSNGNLEGVVNQIGTGQPVGGLIEYFNALPTFSRAGAPIWEDRTTTSQAKVLTEILTSSGGIEKLTGNRAELRFPASQIMKFMEENPEGYKTTKHIQVLSAFISSILAGAIVPVDTGDGWGTNLNTLDIISPSFDTSIANAIDKHYDIQKQAPLINKLGQMTHYDAVVGKIAKYFVKNYEVNPYAFVMAGTGDNPATLLGAGGGLVLSLGSSFTLFGEQPKVQITTGEDNVFGYVPGKSMSLVCFTNGGKLQEEFARKYLNKPNGKLTADDWATYQNMANRKIESGELMLPYLEDESVPVASAGIRRQGFTDKNDATNIAALYRSQMAAVYTHSQHMDIPSEITMVGGAGKARLAKQFTADLFNKPVVNIENFDYAAPIGCAIAAMRHALEISYAEAIHRFVVRDTLSVVEPDRQGGGVARMKKVAVAYRKLEKAV